MKGKNVLFNEMHRTRMPMHPAPWVCNYAAVMILLDTAPAFVITTNPLLKGSGSGVMNRRDNERSNGRTAGFLFSRAKCGIKTKHINKQTFRSVILLSVKDPICIA